MRFVPLILTSVLMHATGQLLLKKAVLEVGDVGTASSRWWPTALRLAGAPWLWSGLACFTVSLVLWLAVLSHVDVSYAFPFFSVGYVFVGRRRSRSVRRGGLIDQGRWDTDHLPRRGRPCSKLTVLPVK